MKCPSWCLLLLRSSAGRSSPHLLPDVATRSRSNLAGPFPCQTRPSVCSYNTIKCHHSCLNTPSDTIGSMRERGLSPSAAIYSDSNRFFHMASRAEESRYRRLVHLLCSIPGIWDEEGNCCVCLSRCACMLHNTAITGSADPNRVQMSHRDE